MDINNPIPQEWGSYVTQSNVNLEVIPSILYDTLTYTDNATTELVFFQQSNVKADISNMKNAGLLANPTSQLVQAIRIFFVTTVETDDQGGAGALASKMNDIILLANTGIATLNIGNKVYGAWPIFTLPGNAGLAGFIAAAGAEAANLTSGYAQLAGPIYSLFPNLMIAPMQSFNVTLAWPSGAVDLSADMVIKVMLDGQQARSVQ
jgi:hypothetical protein